MPLDRVHRSTAECCRSHKVTNFSGKHHNETSKQPILNANKYYAILGKILKEGKNQTNKKGNNLYLLNQSLTLTPGDLLDIFETHGIARKKLRSELSLFMKGERDVENYLLGTKA